MHPSTLTDPAAGATLAPTPTAPARWAPGLRRRWQTALAGPHRYLVLYSHMRSYSSLLAHLLGSSPAVQGYGESHLRYRHGWDLLRLRQRIRHDTGQPLTAPWLLDKVLHNRVRDPGDLLGPHRVRALIFVRRPGPTLQSLMALAHRSLQRGDGRGAAFTDPAVCADYYVQRLHHLRALGERHGQGAVYFDAESLPDAPRRLLNGLSQWLQLPDVPALAYRVGARTGEEGFGDWSPNIRSGQVLGREHSTVVTQRPVPALVLAEAEAAYQRCRASLVLHCASVPDLGAA